MATHRHISRKLLLAARRGQITYQHLAEVLLDRLGSLCPGCREEVEAVAAAEIPQEAYRPSVSRAVRLEAELRRHEEDRKAAPALLAALRGLSAEQRLLRIRNSPERFANVALGEDLIDAARACLPDDLEGSLAWARAAEAVAESYPSPYYPHLVLGIAYQGNAHRAMGDFEGARARLYQARNLMEAHGITDIELGAELNSLLGSFCSDLGRLDEAAEHLENAAALYKTVGDEERLARILIQLGILHGLRDDVSAALEADRAAQALLYLERNQRLYLAARLNFAYHLVDASRPAEARDVLDWDTDLFTGNVDAHTRLRVAWLEARIAGELGDPAAAEAGYLVVREELVRQRHGFNAALACLDLAVLYHGQGRYRELEEVAGQAVELFQAYALHQEALASLLLLRDAARVRKATVERILRVAAFLRQAERSPEARFGPPN
jgi:tetratricopeptide (TPR) repeat protein